MRVYKIMNKSGGVALLAPIVALPSITASCSDKTNQYTVSLKYYNGESGPSSGWSFFTSWDIDRFEGGIGSLTLSYNCTDPNVQASDVTLSFLTNPPGGFKLTQDKSNKSIWTFSWDITKDSATSLRSFKIAATTANKAKSIPANIKFTGFGDPTLVGFYDSGDSAYISLDGTKEIASYQNAWVELTYAWTTLTSAYQKAKLGWSVEQKASPVYSWAECVKYSSRLESLNGIAQTEDTNFNNWGTGTGTKHIAILFERSNDQIKFQFKLNPQDNWGSFKTWYTYYAISSSLMNYYGRTDFSYDPTKITQSYEINQSKSPGATFDYAEHEIWVNLDFINIPVETVEL